MAFDIDDDELRATREKSADEMFKELGYEKENNPFLEIVYGKDNNNIIRFWKPEQKIIKQDKEGWYQGINMQELQAINKKCKELEWLE